MPTARQHLAWLAAALTLSACAVGPNYVRPTAPTTPAFKESSDWRPANPSDAADRRDWWTVFGDATLNDLEQQVAANNQSLAAAEANYRQAHALVAEQRAALFPTVDIESSANLAGAGRGKPSQAYRLGLGATWEPDIWGRIRRGVESAQASAQSSAADLAGARLSLQMELAADYIQLRQLDEEKRILDATVAAYQRTLTVTQNKYTAGTNPKSDVLQAQTQLRSTMAQSTDLIQQRARVEHAIAVLIGKPPADVTIAPAAWTLRPLDIPPTLPSELLERRPDIASAERQAAAASARIGVAIAAFFPTLDLSASGGGAASRIGQLFSASNLFWTLGAAAAETIFDAGARQAQVSQARAAYDAAVATYRETVLEAFAQVEDNLSAQRVLASEQTDRAAAYQAANQALEIFENQYRAGTVDYTSVVVAQTNALNAHNAELSVEAARLTTMVDLIAALGGGWTVSSDPLVARR